MQTIFFVRCGGSASNASASTPRIRTRPPASVRASVTFSTLMEATSLAASPRSNAVAAVAFVVFSWKERAAPARGVTDT
jgi:hypothetical protein